MNGRIACCIALILPTLAAAQNVTVRGGEHPDFTRIVLELPEALEWEFSVAEDGAVFSTKDQNITYDLSRAFELIPRTRLRDLSSEDGRLTFDFECACPADVLEVSASVIAIDIRDEDTLSPRFDVAVMTEAPAQPAVLLTPEEESTVLLRPAPAAAVQRAHTALFVPREAQPTRAPVEAADLPLPLPGVPLSARLARRQALPGGFTALPEIMGSGLARAASQGIVTVEVDPTQTSRQSDGPVSSRLGIENLRVRTRAEIDLDDVADLLAEQDFGNCRPPSYFALSEWVDKEDPWLSVGRARAGLYDARDALRIEGVRDLARAYLGLGFGEEARNVIRDFGYEGRDREVLLAIADIFSGIQLSAKERFEMEVFCSDRPEIFVFLANAKVADLEATSQDALTDYQQLAEHLRLALAPAMIAALLKDQNVEFAYLVFEDIKRLKGGKTEDIAYLRDAIELGETATLQQTDRGREAAAFGAALLRQQQPASKAEFDLLDAYQTENRNAPLEVELKQIELDLLLRSRDYGGAFAHWDARVDSDEAEAILTQIIGDLVANGEVGALLVYLPYAVLLSETERHPDLVRSYQKRLSESGFSNITIARRATTEFTEAARDAFPSLGAMDDIEMVLPDEQLASLESPARTGDPTVDDLLDEVVTVRALGDALLNAN
ncbi:MAG: hypothetical protein HRU32_09175 [Rhodobacteraceae bacterium]|nr:hypothetical protein [Paracoccaceae bacterium]